MSSFSRSGIGPPLDAHLLRPLREPLIRRRQTTRERDRALPQGIVACGPRDWHRVEDMEVQVCLHESARIPVQRDRSQHAERICCVSTVAARPEDYACVDDYDLSRDESGDHRAAVGGARFAAHRDARLVAR
jgi:hypothetical protein